MTSTIGRSVFELSVGVDSRTLGSRLPSPSINGSLDSVRDNKALVTFPRAALQPPPTALGGDQCHRLRNEAAHALYKEQEIGKQTRQALMENDALSRTVERLQKSFISNSNSSDTGGKASRR